ncbi:site-specific DNA-methyltransferase [Solemya velum gill symbiont]|uniref:site-specific DNA-methyltransferase (adenine-specific) n=1 Tax=Solemya velum gill symbiont TaxID=2340 RepID=A0A1T2CG67_SOVGS|nr:site-specific DNA-methyltransferase [Solemya velum gill symbiont]OOY33825.1 site-specific DNA-methyltransferase [Solemya velum gill symbiont]
MDKLKMHSPDITQQNIDKLLDLFPNCKTEKQGDNGELEVGIDFDLLKQELSKIIIESPRERYQLNWPGKKEALLNANAPIFKTLRPCREGSLEFEATKNLFIEGDNLEALKLLQESYLGKVKLVYLDPPYNNGGDFIYEDKFEAEKNAHEESEGIIDEAGNRLESWAQNVDTGGRFHSKWLSMIFQRLSVTRNLMADDGIIVMSIDENEHVNLRKLLDMVFGSHNFAGEIVWKNSSKNDQKYISVQHEYLVIYVKNKAFEPGNWTEKKGGLEEIYKAFSSFQKEFGSNWEKIHEKALEWYKQFPESNPISASKHYSWMDDRGVYFPDNISGPNAGQYVYDVLHPVTGQVCKMPSSGWRYPKEKIIERIADNRVHFGKDHTTVPNNKTYLHETENQSLTSIRFVDGRAASKRLEGLFGTKVFTNPKDEVLLKELFKSLGVRGEDVVLDLFAGSGTTAHALGLLNEQEGTSCRYILAQWPEDLSVMLPKAKGGAKKVTKNAIDYLTRKSLPLHISEITKERLRLVSNNIGRQVDGGFRVLKIDSSNMNEVHYTPDSVSKGDLFNQVEHIKTDRSGEDLLFQVMLDWGVDLSLPIRSESIESKTVYFVNDDDLIACFDKDIDEPLIKALAAFEPLRVVFRDDGFVSDSVKINAEQIFKQLSPTTDIKAI